MIDSEAVVSNLFFYPIKSCQGIETQELEVTARGPAGDRAWLVVDRSGRFVTQRSHAAMAQIHVQSTDRGLVLEAPGMTAFEFGRKCKNHELIPVVVWNDQVTATCHSDEANQWFSRFLGDEYRLVRIAEGHSRLRQKDVLPRPFEVNFADSAPFLLTNAASLRDLTQRVGTEVPMNRFRPNIVIEGATAFAEDTWTSLRIGELAFPALYACDRCSIIQTDQRTGQREKEPLQTLARYRKRGTSAYFGQRMIHEGVGMLRVGDKVTALSRRPAEPFKNSPSQ